MAKQDLKQQAYQILRQKLIYCEYKPGSLLNEAQLSEELGFSRTPIREALNRIEQEGFIRIMPKKGIFVTDISLHDVQQIFEARIQIEPVTLKMAAPSLPRDTLLQFRDLFRKDDSDVRYGFQLDTAMHLFLIDHCGNHFLIDMMHKVFDQNTRVIISSKQNRIQIHDAKQEHSEILDLLLEGEFDQAVQSMCTHIANCRKAALDFFYNPQAYPLTAPDDAACSKAPILPTGVLIP